jgi:hypothetical protein
MRYADMSSLFRRRLTGEATLSPVVLPGGRSQNAERTRQAVRGIKEMFRKDGLLK